MVITDISQWDETICDMIACQHPPCWEALQRIEKGHPRILMNNFNSLKRCFPETEDELPTLKIFNLPFNYYRRIKHAKSYSSAISFKDSYYKDISNYSTSPTMIEAFVPPISALSPERIHFPGLNSRVESYSPHYTPSFTSLKQDEKKQVTYLTDLVAPKLDCQSAYGNLILRWIPDMRHKLLKSERPSTRLRTPTRRMCVKDLALESLLSSKNSGETRPNLYQRKKSNKVPTGGQPYLFHLRRNQNIPSNKSSSPTDKEKKALERSAGKRNVFPSNLQLSPIADMQRKDAIYLENKKTVVPGNKQSLRFVQKVPVKNRGLGRSRSQLQVHFEGSGVPKHLISQQLNSLTLTLQTSEDCSQRQEGEHLLVKTYLPQEAHVPECSPQASQVSINKRKTSLKFVEYKSNRARLFMGCDGSVHQLSKSESKYKQYCKQIAIRKEAAAVPQDDPSNNSRELWLIESPPKPEENLFQSPNPPPPPPSPHVSECSDTP